MLSTGINWQMPWQPHEALGVVCIQGERALVAFSGAPDVILVRPHERTRACRMHW